MTITKWLKHLVKHDWGEWHHNTNYIQSYDAQIRFCKRKGCYLYQRKFPDAKQG